MIHTLESWDTHWSHTSKAWDTVGYNNYKFWDTLYLQDWGRAWQSPRDAEGRAATAHTSGACAREPPLARDQALGRQRRGGGVPGHTRGIAGAQVLRGAPREIPVRLSGTPTVHCRRRGASSTGAACGGLRAWVVGSGGGGGGGWPTLQRPLNRRPWGLGGGGGAGLHFNAL